MTPTEGPEYLTVRQAAARAGRDEQTIRRWFTEGRLTRYRTGPRGVRIRTSELDTLMQPKPELVCTGAAQFQD